MRFALGLTLAAVVFAAGCGGGGSAPAVPAPASRPVAGVTVSITVPSPGSVPPSSARRTTYVSPGTTAVNVFVNGISAASVPLSTGSGGSPATYQVNVSAPVGNDTFRVDLLSGSGATLSTGTTTQQIVAGTNAVALTALGVPAFATIGASVAASRPTPGTTATVALNLRMTDAAGYTIGGVFARPVTLALATSGPGYALSATSIASGSAASAASVFYDGSTSLPARVLVSTDGQNRVAVATIRPGAGTTGNGMLVAAGSGANALYRFDTSTYAQTTISSFGSVSPTAIAASPTGQTAYIGLTSGTILVYDGASKSLTGTVSTGAASVQALAFSDDGQHAYALTLSAGGTFSVFPLPPAAPVATALPPGATSCAAIAPSAAAGVAIVSCQDATYRVDTGLKSVTGTLAPGYGAAAITQALAPYLTYAAAPSGSIGAVDGAATPLAARGNGIAVPSGSFALALDPTEQFLYVGTGSAVVTERVFPDGTSSQNRSIAVPATVTALCDSPGSTSSAPDRFLYAGLADSTVAVIDNTAGTIVKTLPLTAIPIGVAFVP